MPNAATAAAPIEPAIASACSARASSARPHRSSLSASGSIPKISLTAHLRAHCSTRISGVGDVSRLAISMAMTWPWV